MSEPIPVIDLFAGPGGLGEGFAAFADDDSPGFKVALSIEKDEVAHRTLELRAFFRQFACADVPDAYYEHLRNPETVSRSELFERHPDAAAAARQEAWHAELGSIDNATVDRRIRATLAGATNWALIGGPPCQAYSIVGRARRGGMERTDPNVKLYQEYLRILAEHAPPVFVMENVRGLLSAKLDGEWIFRTMLDDLTNPARRLDESARNSVQYRILSLVTSEEGLFGDTPANYGRFVIPCERYGIPQARHRVILLGVRSDFPLLGSHTLRSSRTSFVSAVLGQSH